MKGSFRDRAKKQKENLAAKHQQSYDRKDDKGTNTGSVFNDEVLKELGVEKWNPKEGDHIIDAIPFYAGKTHPDADEGVMVYNVDFWAHQRIGPMNDFFVCQSNTFKLPDPICIYIQKERPDKKDWMKIRPIRRCAYLVWVHDDEKEEAKGIQIFEVAHWFFEKNVAAIARNPRGGGAIPWSHYDYGKHVFFTIAKSGSFEDDTGKSRDSLEYTGFQLVDRDTPSIPDKILNQSFSLDEAMIMHPDDKVVTEAFYGSSSKVVHEDETVTETKSRLGKQSVLERAKARIAEKEAESEVTSKPKTTSDPEPEPEVKTEPEPEVETEPEPEVETEPEPEVETEPEAVSATVDVGTASNQCPYPDIGGEFGVTIEQLGECDSCDQWQECSNEYERKKTEPKSVSPSVSVPKPKKKSKLVRRN